MVMPKESGVVRYVAMDDEKPTIVTRSLNGGTSATGPAAGPAAGGAASTSQDRSVRMTGLRSSTLKGGDDCWI